MGDNLGLQQESAPGVHGVQREQWKQVRTHIHHYEQKLLELQFDYQQKVNIVEALKLELRQTTKDSVDCEEKARQRAIETHEAFKKLQDLGLKAQLVDQDRVMLAQQLLTEQEGLAADTQKYGDTQSFFGRHIEEQQAHIDKLKRSLPPDVATAADLQQQQQHVDQYGSAPDAAE